MSMLGKYSWTAVDGDGRLSRGAVEAMDSRAVAEWLHRDGRAVLSVSRRQWPPRNLHIEHISRRDLIHFTYKLLPLIASHLTLDHALGILRGELKKHRLRNAMLSVRRDMHHGAPLSEALSRQDDIFNRDYVCAVRAGEESGNLAKSLSMIGQYLEWLDHTRRRVVSALAYPLVVAIAMAILGNVLAFYVVPVFMHLYERLGVRMLTPLPTRILFAVSGAVRDYWYVSPLLGAVVLVVYLLRHRIPGLREMTHRIALRLPLIGEMLRQLQALQFCRFFQLLHESGVDTKRALHEAQGVMTNIPMQRSVREILHRLDQGVSLSEAFRRNPDFPPLVAEHLHVGEEAGNVGQALEYVIRYYDAELDYSIRRFIGALGPMMVFGLAFVLLFLALSFYLPMFEIANLINSSALPSS